MSSVLTNSAINTETFGFITVVDTPGLGYCGGLLIVNIIGRPIEFHCSRPIAKNEAQQILYGKTYESFLFGDQIAKKLLGKPKRQPNVLVTDRNEITSLAETMGIPLLLLVEPDSDQDVCFEVHRQRISADCLTDTQASETKELCEKLALSIPLDEPFERIQNAINQAQSTVRPASNSAAA